MKKGLPENTRLVKIGEASKILGVSIDTLRRWEKAGKVKTIRTPGGTRLYPIRLLHGFNQQKTKTSRDLSTEKLINHVQKPLILPVLSVDDLMKTDFFQKDSQFKKEGLLNNIRFINKKIYAKIYAFLLLVVIIFTLIISGLAVIEKVENLTSLPSTSSLSETSNLPVSKQNILAVTTSPKYFEINSDTQVNGSLSVREAINDLVIESTPSGSTFTLTSGGTSLEVTDSSTIDQDLSSGSSPAFSSINLSSSSNQLVLNSGGPSGTLSWTPTVARTITLPDASGEASLLGQTISNSELANSSLTVSAGTNLSGGGSVSLGGSVTLNLKDDVSLSGTLTVSSTTKFNGVSYAWPSSQGSSDTVLSNNGSGTLSWGTLSSAAGWSDDGSIIRLTNPSDNVGIGTSAPGAKLSILGSVGVGVSFANALIPSNGLSVQGNLGVGTTSPEYQLHVIGNAGIGQSLTVGSALRLSSYNCARLTNSGKLTADASGRIVCMDDSGAASSISGSGAANQVSFWDSSTQLTGTNTFYWNNPLMRLGIGSSAPGTTLGVFGSVGIGTSYAFAGLPQSAGNGLIVEGNVGIGTSSPTASLYVSGNAGIGWTGVNPSSSMPGLGLSV